MIEKRRMGTKVRYAFDNIMSRGTASLIGWLALISAVLILLVTLIVYLNNLGPEDKGFFDIAWMGMMRTLDAGTMGGDEGPWGFLFSMFAITLGGVFFISILIGLITTGIENKIEELRKGKSVVMETGHTVILGWTEQVFSIISELVLANENQKRPCIAILANRDKVEMEDEIHQHVGSTKNTRVVCRSGTPIDMSDLEIIGIHGARSIIILSAENGDPDSNVIKTVLAITNNPHRRPEPYHIVAELRNSKNLDVAKMVGKDEVEIILVGDLVARVIAQTCRQSGLSVVYTELLDFGGDEIYFHDEPGLAGKTLGEILPVYEDSSVMGIVKEGTTPLLNPPMDTVITANDKIIVIAEDDDTTKLSGKTDYAINVDAISSGPEPEPVPEKVVILGWNWRAPAIICELDNYVAKGSSVTVVANFEDGEEAIKKRCAKLGNISVKFILGDTTDRATLDGLNLPGYQHVILLCYSDTLTTQQADSITLITLLHLRDISDKRGHPFSIVSEMLDIRNRALAEVTRADDFIVSDRLISLMLSQVSENKQLNAVFADVFDPEGSEIYLKPATVYVKPGMAVNFYTVMESARRRGHIAIGYKLKALSGDAEKAWGVVVNPAKSEMVTFAEGDKIVVIAED